VSEGTKRSEAGDGHASDCAVHNEPAMPNGPCDCHRVDPEPAPAFRTLVQCGDCAAHGCPEPACEDCAGSGEVEVKDL
jgi:hypothetical protein